MVKINDVLFFVDMQKIFTGNDATKFSRSRAKSAINSTRIYIIAVT